MSLLSPYYTNPLMTLAQGNQTAIGAPGVAPQAPNYSGLGGFLSNPLLGMAAGLLTPTPNRSFGGGLTMGLQNMMAMQRQQQATALMGAQIQELRRKRQQAEREQRLLESQTARDAQMEQVVATAFGLPPGVKPTSDQINAYVEAQGQPGAYRQRLTQLTEPRALIEQTIQTGERPEMGEARQIAQAETSLDMISRIEQLAMDPQNIMGPTRAALGQLEGEPFIGDVLQSQYPMSTSQRELQSLTTALSNEVIAAARGAQVGPEEQARYERQLPIPGQPPETFMNNLRNTRENLENLRKRVIEMRRLDVGETPEPTSSAPTVDNYTQEDLRRELARRRAAGG